MTRSLVAVAAALVAGCASAPPTHFHTLLAAGSGASTAQPLAATPRWQLLPVTVPAQVDQPQWVVRRRDGTLALLEDERWIAPLADEIRGALAERLRAGAPAAGDGPAWRIAVDVQRFDSLPGEAARLEAEWSVQPVAGAAGGVLLRCRAAIEQPAGAGYAALAAAHRAALARLGDSIAAALRALDAGRPAACG